LLVYTIVYGPTVFFIKVSILILYQRLFSLKRWMKILIYLGMGYIFLANAIATILFGALCAPRNGEPYIIRYQRPICVDNVNNLALATSIVNLVSDIYLLALPLPLVLKLQLSNKKKTGLVAIFMTGILYFGPILVSHLGLTFLTGPACPAGRQSLFEPNGAMTPTTHGGLLEWCLRRKSASQSILSLKPEVSIESSR